MAIKAAAGKRGGEETAADLGVTTIGGERAGVYTRGEVRDLALCTPGGLLWRPKSGDRVVVLKGGPGGEEAFVLARRTKRPPTWPTGSSACMPTGRRSR